MLIRFPSIISNKKCVILPFYKKLAEYAFKKNSRLVGFILAKMNKHMAIRPPDYVKIETTNICNGRCVYCPRDKMSRNIGVMDFNLYRKIADEVAQWNISTIHLQNYGEPLMDPMIIDRIRYAKNSGIPKVGLFTNGSLLDKTMSDNLVDAGLDEINVSIDVVESKESHDKLRRNLSYDTIVRNLDYLIQLRRKNNIKFPKIVIASIIHSENKVQLQAFLSRWAEQVEEIHFQNRHDWSFYGNKNLRQNFPCFRVWLTLTILWDGRVSLCCNDYDGKHILGCLGDYSLREIWNNSEYVSVRKMHLDSNFDKLDICRKCTLSLKDSPLWIKKILASSKLAHA